LLLLIRPEFADKLQDWDAVNSQASRTSFSSSFTDSIRIFETEKGADCDAENSGNKLIPNVRTFNTLLKGLKQFGKNSFIYTQDVLQEMKNCQVLPDSITINTIVDIGVDNGYLEKAELVSY